MLYTVAPLRNRRRRKHCDVTWKSRLPSVAFAPVTELLMKNFVAESDTRQRLVSEIRTRSGNALSAYRNRDGIFFGDKNFFSQHEGDFLEKALEEIARVSIVVINPSADDDEEGIKAVYGRTSLNIIPAERVHCTVAR